ncbi:hypothetical protein EYF80_054834 [Liparis tanakae]|uniref:Uncharacterized protein n=1 Tax=Liparis tanakae TaxID=230148 RepID=A0A4Z2F1I9_9TELE|nr:hypothetical protein EYF80_054834 [Liparis tanakae]
MSGSKHVRQDRCPGRDDPRNEAATTPRVLHEILVPHVGVPGKEPAGKGEWLVPLFDGGDGDSATPRGVRVHILLR